MSGRKQYLRASEHVDAIAKILNVNMKLLDDEYGNLANKLILIAPTKHFIMYDDPIWFREEVKNFLRNGIAN